MQFWKNGRWRRLGRKEGREEGDRSKSRPGKRPKEPWATTTLLKGSPPTGSKKEGRRGENVQLVCYAGDGRLSVARTEKQPLALSLQVFSRRSLIKSVPTCCLCSKALAEKKQEEHTL